MDDPVARARARARAMFEQIVSVNPIRNGNYPKNISCIRTIQARERGDGAQDQLIEVIVEADAGDPHPDEAIEVRDSPIITLQTEPYSRLAHGCARNSNIRLCAGSR